MKLQPKDERIQRFLLRHLGAPLYRWDEVTDPRDPRGLRWPLGTLLTVSLWGMLTGSRTLRDVEDLSEEMKETGRLFVPRRVPDSTLYDMLPHPDVDQMRGQLRRQGHLLWRSKSLDPVGLPCGVLSVDGKQIATLSHDAWGQAQKAHRAHDGSPYWQVRVLRGVLTSSVARPCVDQMAVPPVTNEMGAFPDFFRTQVTENGALFEIVTVDAGMTSKDNADLVHGANKGYVMALKDNQPELRAEAQRILQPLLLKEPLAQTGWERAKGKLVRRRVYRTLELAGYHDWTHLQQAWLVRQETRDPNDPEGRLSIEDRCFVTNLYKGRLSPTQILQVVRGHWGIENDCFGGMDLQFHEDDRPWCTQGRAIEVLGVLRLMAYNLLQLARTRHLRPRTPVGPIAPPPSWRQLFRWVGQALRLPVYRSSSPMPAD